MEQTTFKLASAPTETIDPNAAYLVDFSKLTSVNDLVLILSAMGFTFAGSHPFIDQVKPFLNLDNPVYPGGQKPAPKMPDSAKDYLNLPKLKAIKTNG